VCDTDSTHAQRNVTVSPTDLLEHQFSGPVSVVLSVRVLSPCPGWRNVSTFLIEKRLLPEEGSSGATTHDARLR